MISDGRGDLLAGTIRKAQKRKPPPGEPDGGFRCHAAMCHPRGERHALHPKRLVASDAAAADVLVQLSNTGPQCQIR